MRLPCMHTGLDPKYDLAHKIYYRRKQHRARILHFGRTGKQRIDSISIEQMFQHATGHHTDRSLFHKRFEDFPQRHRHPCPSFTGSLHLARGIKLSKNSSTLEGLALEVCTRQALPAQWARTQYTLALAYGSRIRGERVNNLEAAIAHFQ